MIDGKGNEVGRWTSSSPISAFSLFPQEDMKSKEASLREKEVVIQKLMNNLNNREGELKVNIISQISCQFFFVFYACRHLDLFSSFEFERRLGMCVRLACELKIVD